NHPTGRDILSNPREKTSYIRHMLDNIIANNQVKITLWQGGFCVVECPSEYPGQPPFRDLSGVSGFYAPALRYAGQRSDEPAITASNLQGTRPSHRHVREHLLPVVAKVISIFHGQTLQGKMTPWHGQKTSSSYPQGSRSVQPKCNANLHATPFRATARGS